MRFSKNVLLLMLLVSFGLVRASDDATEYASNATCSQRGLNVLLGVIVAGSIHTNEFINDNQNAGNAFEKDLHDRIKAARTNNGDSKKEEVQLQIYNLHRPSHRLHTASRALLVSAIITQATSSVTGEIFTICGAHVPLVALGVSCLTNMYCTQQLDCAQRKTQNDKASFWDLASYKKEDAQV